MGPPLTYKNWCIEGILSPQSEADSFSFILTGLLNLGDNGDKVQRKRRAVWDVALPLFLIMQPWLHYMGKAIHVPPERMQHLNLKHEALWDSRATILHTRSNLITWRVAQLSVGGPPMKCKSLSFSVRKRSMMDACQARDESRAELLSWKWQYTWISYAACVKEPIQNSFLLILRRLILGSNSVLVCQRICTNHQFM